MALKPDLKTMKGAAAGMAQGAAAAAGGLMEAMLGSDYPPTAFYFRVAFAATMGMSDTSFQDVSGIESSIETEPYVELGENRYVHKLPKGVSHHNLVLKRGIRMRYTLWQFVHNGRRRLSAIN